jgi:hypothetical protein
LVELIIDKNKNLKKYLMQNSTFTMEMAKESGKCWVILKNGFFRIQKKRDWAHSGHRFGIKGNFRAGTKKPNFKLGSECLI